MLQAEQRGSVVDMLQAGAADVELGLAAGGAAAVESDMLQARAAEVCSGSSTVQASGDDSRSSVELGLSIDQ